MSGINIKKTQDCYQNLLYNMVIYCTSTNTS